HADGDDESSRFGFELGEDVRFGRDGLVTLTIVDKESGELISAQTERAPPREPLLVEFDENDVVVTLENDVTTTVDVAMTIVDPANRRRRAAARPPPRRPGPPARDLAGGRQALESQGESLARRRLGQISPARLSTDDGLMRSVSYYEKNCGSRDVRPWVAVVLL